MSSEIQLQDTTGKTLNAFIRNSIGQIWDTVSLAFVNYVTADLANYAIAMTEQGIASGFYVGNFPATIAAGLYGIVVKEFTITPAESDPVVGTGDFLWNTSVAAIEAKTDKLTFNNANELHSDIKAVNGVTVRGTGVSGDEWGPQ